MLKRAYELVTEENYEVEDKAQFTDLSSLSSEELEAVVMAYELEFSKLI